MVCWLHLASLSLSTCSTAATPGAVAPAPGSSSGRWAPLDPKAGTLTSNLAPGNKEALAAITATSDASVADVIARFRAMVSGDSAAADRSEILEGLQALIRRAQLAPISFDVKPPLIDALTALLDAPPPLNKTDVIAWQTLARDLPLRIVQINRPPIVLPAMPHAQESAWLAILDFEDNLDAHWCLIGGQMVTLACAEHGYILHRPTHDEYGYRYRRGDASIDLLLPEGISGQRTVPTTTTGRRGLEVSGGNQALIRGEKVPVQVGDRIGHVRRPNLLGALVTKAAASLVDIRDTDRHRDDPVVLGRELAAAVGISRQSRHEAVTDT